MSPATCGLGLSKWKIVGIFSGIYFFYLIILLQRYLLKYGNKSIVVHLTTIWFQCEKRAIVLKSKREIRKIEALRKKKDQKALHWQSFYNMPPHSLSNKYIFFFLLIFHLIFDNTGIIIFVVGLVLWEWHVGSNAYIDVIFLPFFLFSSILPWLWYLCQIPSFHSFLLIYPFYFFTLWLGGITIMNYCKGMCLFCNGLELDGNGLVVVELLSKVGNTLGPQLTKS